MDENTLIFWVSETLSHFISFFPLISSLIQQKKKKKSVVSLLSFLRSYLHNNSLRVPTSDRHATSLFGHSPSQTNSPWPPFAISCYAIDFRYVSLRAYALISSLFSSKVFKVFIFSSSFSSLGN